MKPELSIILPVYNQADHIGEVVSRFLRRFKNRSWEIILVPNGCRDDSPGLCRALAAKDRRVRVLEISSSGWGLAVRRGIQVAKGRNLCYANSARTNPEDIIGLFNLYQEYPGSLAKVTRHSRGDWVRSLGSVFYNLECRLLFGLSSADVNGTPKIFSPGLWRRARLASNGDLLDIEFLVRCKRLGIALVEKPVGGWTRHGGKSSMSFKSAFRLYRGALKLWWSWK